MKEFDIKDYYNDFINYTIDIKNKLNYEIHKLISIKFNIKNDLIENYYNYLVKYKVNLIDIINNIEKGIKLKVIDNNEFEIEFVFIYNQLLITIDTINNLSKELIKYSYLSTIPFKIYRTIQFSINYELSINILKGRKTIIPLLGELLITRIPYNSTIPDWGKSIKFKQFLEEQGYEIKDKNNPDGKNWLVDNGLDRDDFCILKWKRNGYKLSNKYLYKLRPSVRGNINLKRTNNRIFSLEELFKNTSTGLFDKIIHIYKYHYEYAKSTYPFIKHNILKAQRKI